MSKALPDPSTFGSWEDAFQYPIAVTRQIEKQLHSDVEGNKQRLRNLVGASYRDLLDTAERISHLDQRMQETESQLGSISINCNSALVDRKLVGVQNAKSDIAKPQLAKQSQSAQLILLQKSKNIVTRLLKTKGSVLLAAKLLTVSRLLHKTLSQTGEYAELLEIFRKHIASLRRALLKRIDRYLGSLRVPIEQLIEAISAFCLATNSSSIDAVKHFQHVRLEAIRQLLERKRTEQENVGQAVQSYIQTLRTTRVLLGRRLSDAFKDLRTQPLIHGTDLLDLDELALDTYGKWTPQEVQNFVPWIKVAGLSKSEIITFCRGWSKTAFDRLIKGFTTQVQGIDSIDDILALRRTVLKTWLESWSSTPTHGPSTILNALRKTFNDRIIALTEDKAAALKAVTMQAQKLLGKENLDSSNLSLWNGDFVVLSISHGATEFKEELMNRHLGLSDDMLSLKKTFDSWLSNVQDNKLSITQIGNAKWTDIIEDDEQDDSDFDEDDPDLSENMPRLTVRSIERHLQKSDVDDLIESQNTSIKKAISSLQNELLSISHPLCSSNKEAPKDPLSAIKTCLLLRLIRLISQRLVSSFPDSNLTDLNQVIPDLHRYISNIIIARLSQNFPKQGRRVHPSMRHLWEPTSPSPHDTKSTSSSTTILHLPTLPSPTIFRFLRTLSLEMSSFGPDLWTPSALTILKSAIHSELDSSADLRQALHLELSSSTSTNNDNPPSSPTLPDASTPTEKDEDTPSTTHGNVTDTNIQTLFNALYLSQAFSSSSSTKWLDRLNNEIEVEPRAMKVLEQRAREYWARSGLLFGVLGGGEVA